MTIDNINAETPIEVVQRNIPTTFEDLTVLSPRELAAIAYGIGITPELVAELLDRVQSPPIEAPAEGE